MGVKIVIIKYEEEVSSNRLVRNRGIGVKIEEIREKAYKNGRH